MIELEKQMEVLNMVDGILKEAIEALDRGEKVNGLEYARELIEQLMEPEVLCKVEHVTIYFTYEAGNYNDRLAFWYTAVKSDSVTPSKDFDIRDLPNWGWRNSLNRDLHADCVREALWHGHLNEYLKSVGIEPIPEGKSGKL